MKTLLAKSTNGKVPGLFGTYFATSKVVYAFLSGALRAARTAALPLSFVKSTVRMDTYGLEYMARKKEKVCVLGSTSLLADWAMPRCDHVPKREVATRNAHRSAAQSGHVSAPMKKTPG